MELVSIVMAALRVERHNGQATCLARVAAARRCATAS